MNFLYFFCAYLFECISRFLAILTISIHNMLTFSQWQFKEVFKWRYSLHFISFIVLKLKNLKYFVWWKLNKILYDLESPKCIPHVQYQCLPLFPISTFGKTWPWPYSTPLKFLYTCELLSTLKQGGENLAYYWQSLSD